MSSRFTRVFCAFAILLGASPTSAQVPDQGPIEEGAVVSFDEVFADRRAMTEGTNVWFERVRVRARSGNVLEVGRGRRSIFVAPIDPSSVALIPVGSVIDVRGMLRRAPSAAQGARLFAMDAGGARRLAHDRVYVDAWFVSE